MDSSFNLPPGRLVEGRKAYVVDHSRGKRVLHVGCVDAGLTEERLRSGELLHGRLHEVADELWGVDVDQAGLELLSRRFDRVLLVHANELNVDPRLRDRRFDVIVATELLEHLSNPGKFLDVVRDLMVPEQTQLLISVPNATRLPLLWTIPRGVELVHPDHVAWYSYYTITNLLRRHGFRVEETAMYLAESLPRLHKSPRGRRNRSIAHRARRALGLPGRLAAHYACRLMPYFADGVIVLASLPARSR